jgi:hypothetical protein
MKKLLVAFLLLPNIFCFAQNLTHADSLVIKNLQKKVDSLNRITAIKKARDPLTVAIIKCYVNNDGICFTEKSAGHTKEFYPDDYICVQTDSSGIALAENNLDTFRLWIDGICYNNITPLFIDQKESALIFKLNYDSSKYSPWKIFYAYPNYWTFYHKVTINIGTLKKEFKSKIDTHKMTPEITLHTSVLWMMVVGYLILVALLVSLILFAKGIMKDVALYAKDGVKVTYKKSEPTDAAKGQINVRDLPYSLSRFQFLFWLIIIFASIVHIWAITDSLTTPTGTVLMLLGISGSTFYIGRLIDKKDETPPAGVPVKTASQIVTDFINNDSKSRGLMFDLLNDGKAISLHRLQLLIFTVFLGIHFLWQVIYGLALPEFSATMMTLMGISSGTYAGMKTTE